MQKETLRTELNLQLLYQRLLPTVYRVAYTYMKNSYDSEDAAQEAFIRLAARTRAFADEREVKAWLVVTVSNICKDMLRRKHRQDLNVEDYPDLPAPDRERDELLDALMELPDRIKTAIYFYYYEGYGVKEIARAMRRSEGTVKSWLHRGRAFLKRYLEEESQ